MATVAERPQMFSQNLFLAGCWKSVTASSLLGSPRVQSQKFREILGTENETTIHNSQHDVQKMKLELLHQPTHWFTSTTTGFLPFCASASSTSCDIRAVIFELRFLRKHGSQCRRRSGLAREWTCLIGASPSSSLPNTALSGADRHSNHALQPLSLPRQHKSMKVAQHTWHQGRFSTNKFRSGVKCE